MRARLAGYAVGVIAFTAALTLAGPRNIKKGDPIGDLRLNSITGETVSSANRSGRPSVWIFINPQQASSESALIALQRAVDDMPAPGVAAVALTSDASHIAE